MTYRVPVGRQPLLVAEVELDHADFATGVAVKLFDLPPGAVVVGGHAQVVVAGAATTSSVLDVGYDLPTGTDDPDAFITAFSLLGAASTNELVTANSATGVRGFPIGCDVTATRTLVGADTTPGSSRVSIQYYIKDKADFVQTS